MLDDQGTNIALLFGWIISDQRKNRAWQLDFDFYFLEIGNVENFTFYSQINSFHHIENAFSNCPRWKNIIVCKTLIRRKKRKFGFWNFYLYAQGFDELCFVIGPPKTMERRMSGLVGGGVALGGAGVSSAGLPTCNFIRIIPY